MCKKVTVLVVDDDPEIREIVCILLQREGFCVLDAADAKAALAKLEAPVDLIILDIMMPGCSGLELCTEIRKTATIPILFLTAMTRDIDKAEGLSRGGDDYLVKPFSSLELVSRVKALLRRCLVYQGTTAVPVKNVLSLGGLQIDFDTGTVTRNGQAIDLTGIEYQILCLLLKNRKDVLSAREIYERIWQEPFLPVSNNTVMVHIKNLRKKLEEDIGHPQYIHTVWGKGYYIG